MSSTGLSPRVSSGNDSGQLLVFELDGKQYALRLHAVDRVVPAVEISSLPQAPEVVSGIVNVQGRVVPVFDIRKRFRLPAREMDLGDRLIIAQTGKRAVALVVERVAGVILHPGSELTAAGEILPGLDYIEGVVKLDGGLILIHDLNSFLSIEEEEKLKQAMLTA